jgi:hypothetical protein
MDSSLKSGGYDTAFLSRIHAPKQAAEFTCGSEKQPRDKKRGQKRKWFEDEQEFGSPG